MLSSLIIAAILTAAAAFLAWPLVGNIFLGLPEPMLGSGTALDIIPGCASWWSSLCWTDHFQPMGLITLAGLLPTFGAIAQSAGDRRAEDGGPLGNAKVVDNKRAVRKASDTWSGRGTPKGCGLVYGYSGGEFLYSSKTPHTITITASGGGKTVFLVLPTIYVCSSCGANLIVSDSKNEKLLFSALTTLVLGIYLMGYYNLIDLFTDLPNVNTMSEYLALYLIPCVMSGYIAATMTGWMRRMYHFFVAFDLCFIAAALAAHFSNRIHFTRFLYVSYARNTGLLECLSTLLFSFRSPPPAKQNHILRNLT